MNVYLLPRQVKQLESESKKSGSSVAEIIRRAIDKHLFDVVVK